MRNQISVDKLLNLNLFGKSRTIIMFKKSIHKCNRLRQNRGPWDYRGHLPHKPGVILHFCFPIAYVFLHTIDILRQNNYYLGGQVGSPK